MTFSFSFRVIEEQRDVTGSASARAQRHGTRRSVRETAGLAVGGSDRGRHRAASLRRAHRREARKARPADPPPPLHSSCGATGGTTAATIDGLTSPRILSHEPLRTKIISL